MERGFKYRIYPNASQRDQIARTLGCCRFVYNRALDVKKSAYAKTGKTVSWAELSRMLPAWKRDDVCGDMDLIEGIELALEVNDPHGAHLSMSHDNGIDCAYIPINYCPICGRNFRKDR